MPTFVPFTPRGAPAPAVLEPPLPTDRSPRIWLHAAAFALLVALIVPSAHAATIIARTDVELTQLSDAVVVASVERVASELAPDGQVRTRNTLAVESWWKGQGPSNVDVLQPGGEWEGRKTALHGDFALQEGRRVVMFLQQGPDGFYSTLLSWSVYDVHGADLNAPVQRQAKDLELKKRGPDGRLADVDGAQDAKTLGGLKATVLALAGKGAQR